MLPEDPFGIAYDPGGYGTITPIKIFWYNDRLWGYFTNPGLYDMIGYFDTTAGTYGRWLYSPV
jgi:hypothetical protein